MARINIFTVDIIHPPPIAFYILTPSVVIVSGVCS